MLEDKGDDDIDVIALQKKVGAIPLGARRSLYTKRRAWKKISSRWILRIILKGTNLYLGKVTRRIRVIRHVVRRLFIIPATL